MAEFYCFVRFESRTVSVPLPRAGVTVHEFKQALYNHPQIGVPVAQQQLVRAGCVMTDDQTLSDFCLNQSTTLHLIRRQEPAPGDDVTGGTGGGTGGTGGTGGGGDGGVVGYVRPPYVPLPITNHDLPMLPDDLFDAPFYVWCRAETPSCSAGGFETHEPRCGSDRQCQAIPRHRSIGLDSNGSPYPHQLQPAAARPRCAACFSESVIVTERSIPWSTVFTRRVPGECLHCGHTNIEVMFICRGELEQPIRFPDIDQQQQQPPQQQAPVPGVPGAPGAPPSYLVRSTCRSRSVDGVNFPIPNSYRNTTRIDSIDSGAPDQVQLQFHPCGHRLNANGLNHYVTSLGDRRRAIVQNSKIPEVFGTYVVRCCTPDCTGIIYLPSCRLAGSDLYDVLREWATVEMTLQDGGVLCPLAQHRGLPAFLPPRTEPGPCRKCSTCNEHFCEEHKVLWNSCPHTMNEEDRIRHQIQLALTEGAIRRCPNPSCAIYGTKDEASTHMRCDRCDTRWCYFCGIALADRQQAREHNRGWEQNNTKCPDFLDAHPLLEGSPIEALAKYHHLRTLRLLRELRRNIEISHPGVFDRVIRTLNTALLTVEATSRNEDGQVVSATSPLITVEMIIQPQPMTEYALP